MSGEYQWEPKNPYENKSSSSYSLIPINYANSIPNYSLKNNYNNGGN